MAVLDPRLIPLIETLTSLGADWLAFELIDGVRRGREFEETPSSLAISRQQIREGDAPKPIEEESLPTSEPLPILGDDQIEWAVTYVIERLDAALAEFDVSLDNLDQIVVGQAVDPPMKHYEDAGEMLIVLSDGPDQRKVDRDAIQRAQALIPRLRTALEGWSNQVRSDSPT